MRWFMFAMVLANIGGQMFPTLMPLYLTELGASVGQVGLVYTLSSIVILALQIVGGWVSDSIGRLKSIAIGSVGGIIGITAMFLAPTWEWMLVAISVNMIPYALVGPSFGAFIAENSAEENRGKVYGMTGTIYQITGVVGPLLGGILAGSFGFRAMLGAAVIFYTIAAGLRIWMATTMRSPQEREPTRLTLDSFKLNMRTMMGMLLAGGVVTWILVTDGVSDFAFRLSGNLESLYLDKVGGLSVEQIGLLGSIFSLSMMFVPMLSGRMVDRYGERVPMVLGFVMLSGGTLIFVLAHGFEVFALSWIISGFAIGLLDPAYQSLISKVIPSRLLGTFEGVFSGTLGFFSLPAPYLGAQIWEGFGPQMPFYIRAITPLVILPAIWFKFKAPKNVLPEDASPGTVLDKAVKANT